MLMSGLNVKIDQLFMPRSMHLYGHVFWKKWVHVARWPLDVDVEGQREAEMGMEEAA